MVKYGTNLVAVEYVASDSDGVRVLRLDSRSELPNGTSQSPGVVINTQDCILRLEFEPRWSIENAPLSL